MGVLDDAVFAAKVERGKMIDRLAKYEAAGDQKAVAIMTQKLAHQNSNIEVMQQEADTAARLDAYEREANYEEEERRRRSAESLMPRHDSKPFKRIGNR